MHSISVSVARLGLSLLCPGNASYRGDAAGHRCLSLVPRVRCPTGCQGTGRNREGWHRSTNNRRYEQRVRAATEATTSEGTAPNLLPQEFKHILFPIIDSNPYLSSASRQGIMTTTAMARAFKADVTVVVVELEGSPEVDQEVRTKTIRLAMEEGGFETFGLIGKGGKNAGAIIGEVADDLNLDLVVLGMEHIHQKHIDGNTLAEFVPCPVLLVP